MVRVLEESLQEVTTFLGRDRTNIESLSLLIALFKDLVVEYAREKGPHLSPRVVFQLAVQGREKHAPQAGPVQLGFGFRSALHAAGGGPAHLRRGYFRARLVTRSYSIWRM